MRLLLFMRHAEAVKNVRKAFGGSHGDDTVTDNGMRQITSAVQVVNAWLKLLGVSKPHLYSSTSDRVSVCSGALCSAIGAQYHLDVRLSAISKGKISGLSEQSVAEEHPIYHRKLGLYRMGILNSYDIEHPGEGLRSFELRVSDALNEIETKTSSASIICAHKSTITAALMRYARLFHGYPDAFFGFSDIPLCSLSLISLDSPGEIAFAGVRPEQFLESFTEWQSESNV